MEVPTRNVDITSPFWSAVQSRSRTKTIPALVKAQKESGHWYCLTWKEGHQPRPHVRRDTLVTLEVLVSLTVTMKAFLGQ